ncbi:hypothetical protein C0V97_01060 [Asaia sp. W19]|uniref:DUF935 domain-containing protein n=1 Tax=unclassified Asaia TaxID=2685023 RepID=UPI000F8C9CEA|nr:DUF935 family protein [Asaia sp. W19]RUT27388.1 hypothetical protein C0V97_01060 [Asaia sp. W19]
MKLLDQWGNPIQPARLSEPVAGPDVFGNRPAIISTPIIGLDPEMMGAAMRAADQGDSLAWQTIAETLEERDLHYLGVLNTRKRTVAQLPITVSAASSDPEHEKHKEFIEAWLRDELVAHMLFDMLDAIGKGWSVHELTWALNPGENRIVDAVFRPQRWFDVSNQDGSTIMIREFNSAPMPAVVPGGVDQIGFIALDPRKFVVHKHPSWSGLPLRSGLTRAVAWASMFKAFSSRDWGLFVQAYGLPMRVGFYRPGATEQERRVLMRAVTDLAGAAAAIIPEGMKIEFHEPKNGAGANDIHQRRCEWLDAQISKAVIGQTGTADSKQGAHASGAIHRMVQEDIERADARLATRTVNMQMIEPMIAMTFGPQKAYPKISIGRPDEVPMDIVTTALQWLGPQDLKVKASELRQRLGLTDPEDGDEIVGGRAPTPPPTPPHDLSARIEPAEDRPGTVPPATIRDLPAVAEGKPATASAPPGQTRTTRHSALDHEAIGRMVHRFTQAQGPGIVTALSESLSRDAKHAMETMEARAREAFGNAKSFEEMTEALQALDLPSDELADVMAKAMLVAELAGEATILDQMMAQPAKGRA